MEWTVNTIFKEEVTKITSSMLPPHISGDLRTTRAVQEQVSKIIDDLGEASAVAQGLNKRITSAEKLRNNPTHVVYLLKDHCGQDGNGEVIGMIKVGRKHLFLFDDKEQVHEVEPLCVLDFYVVSRRQRMGYGRKLYEHMLRDSNTMAWEMAIDGPSHKMEHFLCRNFGIEKLSFQNNNFAVAPNFFDRSDAEISKAPGRSSSAVAAAVGRFAALQPPSSIADVIHGAAGDERSPRSPSNAGAAAPTVEGAGAASLEGAGAAVEQEAGTAVVKKAGVAAMPSQFPNYYDYNQWEEDWDEPETELDDDAYEQFDPDQPAFERRDEMRARVAYRSQAAPERPASLRVRADEQAPPRADEQAPPRADAAAQSAAGTPSSSGRRDSQLTERGYFDVKYYHNKLW